MYSLLYVLHFETCLNPFELRRKKIQTEQIKRFVVVVVYETNSLDVTIWVRLGLVCTQIHDFKTNLRVCLFLAALEN